MSFLRSFLQLSDASDAFDDGFPPWAVRIVTP
jgi:hypothetical protein